MSSLYCFFSVYQQSVHCLLYYHVTVSREPINDGLHLSPSSPEEINSVKQQERGGVGVGKGRERKREKGRDRLRANSFLMRKP